MKNLSYLIFFTVLFMISTAYAAPAPSSAVKQESSRPGVMLSSPPSPATVISRPPPTTPTVVPPEKEHKGALRTPEGSWSPVMFLSSGYGFAVDVDGALFSWGRDYLGRLGLGLTPTKDEYGRFIEINVTTPQRIGNESGWTDVSAAGSYVHGIKSGEIWSWGGNITNAPVKIADFGGGWIEIAGSSGGITYALKGDKTLWKFEEDGNDLERFGTDSDWVSIDAYGSHICGLREGVGRGMSGVQRTLWCWGSNGYGEVGNGATTTVRDPNQVQYGNNAPLVVRSYALGQNHTCAVAVDGTLYCWGRGDFHQIGEGGHPLSVGVGHIWPVSIDSGYDSVSAGRYHNCAIKTNGALFCWGCNKYGQLGRPTKNECYDESHVDYDSCAFCAANQTAPAMVGSDYDWESASLGEYSTCALKKKGQLFCFGFNRYGSGLGIGDREERFEVSPVEVKKGPTRHTAVPVVPAH